MKRVINLILSTITVLTILGSATTVALPQTAYAADDKSNSCDYGLLGFPTWYRGINNGGSDCEIQNPRSSDELSGFVWHIVLNVIGIGLMATGYVTLGFIMYGGFLFFTSQGESEKMVAARRTIINASIGLVIAMCSVAIVSFVANGLE